MLTMLRIKNLALVQDLALELQPGLNVITGETGAGKSILIGALTLVLGERADRTLIRSGTDTCVVEAVFDTQSLAPSVEAFLDASGLEPCADRQLVLKRSFTAAGANRQFVNGSPTTLATLAALGESLVDIHGPHDHQSLLHPDRQLAILDAFGNLGPARQAVADLVRRRAALEQKKTALITDEQTYAQQLDLLRFQVRDIAAARLQPDEDAAVGEAHQRATSAARRLELGQAALNLLGDTEPSLLTQTGALGRILQELQRLDPAAAPLAAAQEQAAAQWRDLQTELAHYVDRVDLDPARLRELENRLNLIQTLKRKYGPTLPGVIAFGDDARRRLASLEQRDAELARLNAELETVGAELRRRGRDLSARRRKLLPRLRKAVERELGALGFRQSRFDITLGTRSAPAGLEVSPADTGFDTIEFQFAPNPGEPGRPLRAIASSGEMARVMLGLKTVLAAEDEIPVLIFDEVDANIGGETAHAVGAKMRQIATQRQVLCVTHLPQVAVHGHAHYVVTKQLLAGRTVSAIQRLEPAARVVELARMLGGPTDAARRHAAALLGSGSGAGPE
ncbi:MAG: DNA repair protein RecN [Verrucomicrobia bacterium]|nr:DNA repair protein RecN [Verrucomicrobiota bacterium]